MHLLSVTVALSLVNLAHPNPDEYPYASEKKVLTRAAPRYVEIVDMDHDGDNDLFVVSDSQFVWYENRDGRAGELLKRTIDGSFETNTARVGDIDGDGQVDIVAIGRTEGIVWWRNKVKGRTWQRIDVNAKPVGLTVRTGDFDGDGDQDIAYSDSNSRGGIYWFANSDGQGTRWGNASTVVERYRGAPFGVGDVDGDGDDDLLTDSQLWISDQGPWIAKNIDLGGSARPVDFDMDGDIDFLGVSPKHVTLYENVDGDLGADPILTSPPRRANKWVAAATDVDGDGDNDLVCATHSYEKGLTWHENNNGQWIEHVVLKKWEGPEAIDAGDLDGDGDMDFVAVSYNGGKISWFENQGRRK